MMIRLFYSDKAADFPLNGMDRFTVGGSRNDNVCLIGCGLKPAHVSIEQTASGWKLSCNGSVTYKGRSVKEGKLLEEGNYVLEGDSPVALLAYEPGPAQRIRNVAGDGPVSIGRKEDNTVALPSMLVSRHHCVIRKVDGEYYIEDKGSKNGTYLNHTRLENRQKLQNGTVIYLGNATMRLTGSSLEVTAPTQPQPDATSGAGGDALLSTEPDHLVAAASAPETEKKVQPVRSPRLSESGCPAFFWEAILIPSVVALTLAAGLTFWFSDPMFALLFFPLAAIGSCVSLYAAKRGSGVGQTESGATKEKRKRKKTEQAKGRKAEKPVRPSRTAPEGRDKPGARPLSHPRSFAPSQWEEQALLNSLLALVQRQDTRQLQLILLNGTEAQIDRLRSFPHLRKESCAAGQSANRCISSIRSELRRRERLFARSGVEDFEAYIQLFNADCDRTEDAEDAELPRWVVMVNRFLDLRERYPKQFQQLASAAQVGRMYGIYVVFHI